MTDADRFRLLHGPYTAPPVAVGSALYCELRRRSVPVVGFSAASIPWPMTRGHGRGLSLILCGGLVEAVQRESAIAVSHWWGVAQSTVSNWRKAFGIPRMNDGSARLQRKYTPERFHRDQ
jgi:hypothetical protein